MTTQPTCEERWRAHYDSRTADLTRLWELHAEDPDAYDDDLGNLYEYGLSFDYVAPETFEGQLEGYWRYQLSWGGPSDEIRFFASTPTSKPYRIEYWFLDWWDGHGQTVKHDVYEELWWWFEGAGSTAHAMEEANP